MKMKAILYEKTKGGYYGGLNKKYCDMFNFTADEQDAKILNIADAENIKDDLNKRGYNFVIVPV